MHITFKLVTLNCDYFGYYRLQITIGVQQLVAVYELTVVLLPR